MFNEAFLVSNRISIRIAANPDYTPARSSAKVEDGDGEDEGDKQRTSLASSWSEVGQVRNLPFLTACSNRCNYPSRVSSPASEENFRVKSQERQVRQSASWSGCVLCQFDVIRHRSGTQPELSPSLSRFIYLSISLSSSFSHILLGRVSREGGATCVARATNLTNFDAYESISTTPRIVALPPCKVPERSEIVSLRRF